MRACVCACVNICMRVCVYICMYMNVCIYMCICIICIYIQGQIHRFNPPSPLHLENLDIINFPFKFAVVDLMPIKIWK